MLYTNSENTRYVDMCKEFDEEFWKSERDDAKLFRYCYLVFYMLACKSDYFKKFEDYDDYASYSATIIYMRFLKKLSRGVRIKSLLNYAKRSKRFLKINYQKQAFSSVVGPNQGIDSEAIRQILKNSVQSNYSNGMKEELSEVLENITDIIEKVLNESRFKHNMTIRHRVELSIMLTLLNGITLSKEFLKSLNASMKKGKKRLADSVILSAIEQERTNALVVWRLPYDKYKYIVTLLVNRVRQELSASLNKTIHSYTLPDDVIDSILASAYEERNLIPEQEEDYD